MSTFRTIPSGRPLRAILVGAGPMGRTWLQKLVESSDVDPVGLVDLDLEAAAASAQSEGIADIPLATSVTELLTKTDADIVVNVTAPVAHYSVSSEALRAGLPVLSEKPIAPTVAEAVALAAISEDSGQLLMVSQSRRYSAPMARLRDIALQLGPIGLVSTDFFTAPHFGGFRDEMAHPLLVDMAIHAFDCFRYLLDDEPVSVYCETFNPSWSWYAGDAGAVAHFITARGVHYVYTGTWCSPGLETSWNGQWRISGEYGSAVWDGEAPATWESSRRVVLADPIASAPGLAGALAEFTGALRSGSTPSGVARSNLLSLAMVEAAVESAQSGQRVELSSVIARALDRAIESEHGDGATQVLRDWIATDPGHREAH